MKNHGYALLSRSLPLSVYIINFCPKRTNEQTKMLRADKMAEPVDCLAASDHLLSCLPVRPPVRLISNKGRLIIIILVGTNARVEN